MHPLANDLDFIFKKTKSLWEALRNQHIFITGATGFFGTWLLESFVWANQKLNLNAKAVVLTRNYQAFQKKCPHLTRQSSIQFISGDIRNFVYPPGEFSHVIHAATETNTETYQHDPQVLNIIVQGTKHCLEFARKCQSRYFLFISSGAVYGKANEHTGPIAEDDPAKTLDSAYAIGKSKAEAMVSQYAEKFPIQMKIARCFTFAGPYFPLRRHFAISQFIHAGLSHAPILIKSDGRDFRSYLYAADLAVWLWSILFLGENARPYNVGSTHQITIAQLAMLVADTFPIPPEIKMMQKPKLAVAKWYVPNTDRARIELGLHETYSLLDAIHAMKDWYIKTENFDANVI